MNLKKEKSCGCIIVNNKKVLLIYEKNRNFWGFPKGHMEAGETEIDTAKREVKEEVGMEVDIDTSKRYELNYIIDNEIDKTSVFYLATTENSKITKQQSEVELAKWCSFEETLDMLTFDDWKEMFKKVLKDLNINI